MLTSNSGSLHLKSDAILAISARAVFMAKLIDDKAPFGYSKIRERRRVAGGITASIKLRMPILPFTTSNPSMSKVIILEIELMVCKFGAATKPSAAKSTTI